MDRKALQSEIAKAEFHLALLKARLKANLESGCEDWSYNQEQTRNNPKTGHPQIRWRRFHKITHCDNPAYDIDPGYFDDWSDWIDI